MLLSKGFVTMEVMSAENPRQSPGPLQEAGSILATKEELLSSWKKLPDEHKATMALVLVTDIMAGDYRTWLQSAMATKWPLQTGQLEVAYPHLDITKDDLRRVQFDEEEIDRFTPLTCAESPRRCENTTFTTSSGRNFNTYAACSWKNSVTTHKNLENTSSIAFSGKDAGRLRLAQHIRRLPGEVGADNVRLPRQASARAPGSLAKGRTLYFLQERQRRGKRMKRAEKGLGHEAKGGCTTVTLRRAS